MKKHILIGLVLVALLSSVPLVWAMEGDYTGEHWDTSDNTYDPRGITTDGNYIWIVDHEYNEVFKYIMVGVYTTEHWDISEQSSLGVEDIATDGNYIWIVDSYDDEVYKYSMTGGYINSWDISGQSSIARGITTDGSYIWIADTDDNEVYKYTMDGVYTDDHWDTSVQTTWMSGITTDGRYIWVVDKTNDEVYRYTMAGAYITSWDTSGQVINGNDIATDGMYIWVIDYDQDEVFKYECTPPSPPPSAYPYKFLRYDGDDYVNVLGTIDMNFTGGDFTVECWHRRTLPWIHGYPPVEVPAPVAKMSMENHGWELYCTIRTTDTEVDEVWAAFFGYDLEWDEFNAEGYLDLSDYEWHHIVGRRSGADFELWVNGILDWIDICPDVGDVDSKSNFTVGVSIAADEWTKGDIDEVRLYNRNITDEEIVYSYSNLEPLNQTGLVLWLRFNEGTGDTAYDETTNDNDGTLMPNYPSNAPEWVDETPSTFETVFGPVPALLNEIIVPLFGVVAILVALKIGDQIVNTGNIPDVMSVFSDLSQPTVIMIVVVIMLLIILAGINI